MRMRLPPSPRPFTGNASRGFTLIELTLALIIMSLLTGSVYSILRASIGAAADVQRTEMENDQVNQFIRLCRQAFQNLPSTATITLKIVQPGSPAIDELTISGAPECFGFGANPISYKDTILSTQLNTDASNASADGSSVYDVAITREDIIPSDGNQGAAVVQSSLSGSLTADAQGRTWLPLLANVASLSWRCYQDDTTQWVDEWDNTNLPQLVEMNLQLVGRSQPMRVVFTIPGTKIAGANAALKPTTTTTDDGGGGGSSGGRGRGKGGDKGKGKGGDEKGKGKGGDTKGKNKSGTNRTDGKEGKSNKSSSKSSDKGSSNKSSGESSKSSSGSSKGGGSSSGGSSSSGGRR